MSGFVFEQVRPRNVTLARGNDAGFGDMVAAGFEEAALTSNLNSYRVAGEEAYDRIIDDIRERTGRTDFDNPYRVRPGPRDYALSLRSPYNPQMLARQRELARFQDRYRMERESQRKKAMQIEDDAAFGEAFDKILPDLTWENVEREYVMERLADIEATRARAGAFDRTVGGFTGGVGAMANDPFQVATAPVGISSKTIVGAMAKGALVNAGIEGTLQPAIAQWHNDLGLDYGAGDAGVNVAFAAIFAGGISGAGKAIELKGQAARDYWKARENLANLPADHPLKKLTSGDRKEVLEAAQEIDDAIGLEDGARAALDREALVLAQEADKGPEVSAAIDSAEEAVTNPMGGPPVRVEPVPAVQRVELPEEQDGRQVGEQFVDEAAQKPYRYAEFDPRTIETDARTMQYKGGGDSQGVTDALRDVKRWDPVAAGDVLVWERADGTRIIVDGHQRSGLARRLIGEGEDDITLRGYLFRERDGWTASEMRAKGAKKNIQNGTGDVLDTAQAFRESPDIIDDSLPVSAGEIRQARALARLSDDVWTMARNERIQANYAAVIGETIPDKDMHASVAQNMIEAGVSNIQEARYVARASLEAGTVREVQDSLFGPDVRSSSLLGEKTKLISAIDKILKTNKRVFATLSREADRIEAAGNQLNEAGNTARAIKSGQLNEVLLRLATRRSSVADDLNRLAEDVAQARITRTEAAREMVAVLESKMDEGGLPALLADAPPARDSVEGPASLLDKPEAADYDRASDEIEADLERDEDTFDMFGTEPERAAAAEEKRMESLMDRFKDCAPKRGGDA